MAKKQKIDKTNAMRQLDSAGIEYEMAEYDVDESDLSGVHAAAELGVSEDEVFKTLVTKGAKGGYFVFCIPVAESLNLKKCAALAGEKSVEMIHVKDMLSVTGYIRGGCSPVGMKKKYPIFLDETSVLYDTIYVSGGQRGLQLCLSPEDLCTFVDATVADLIRG